MNYNPSFFIKNRKALSIKSSLVHENRDNSHIWKWYVLGLHKNVVNSSPHGQNGRHFADDILIFMNQKFLFIPLYFKIYTKDSMHHMEYITA